MKHILVQIPGPLPLLIPAVALSQHDTGMLLLDSIVNMPDGPTDIVPIEYCFEFDEDLMDRVNRLVGRATDATLAAQQIIRHEAVPVTIETATPLDEPTLH
jgi:hypothetical protein